jgi:hypothetical protein
VQPRSPDADYVPETAVIKDPRVAIQVICENRNFQTFCHFHSAGFEPSNLVFFGQLFFQ